MKQIESNFMAMVSSSLANLNKDQAYWSFDPDIVSEVNAINSEYNLGRFRNSVAYFLNDCSFHLRI